MKFVGFLGDFFGFQCEIYACDLRPERPKGAKDNVKRPEGPPAKSRAQDC